MLSVSAAQRRPSYDELAAALFDLQERVGRLEAENAELSADNAVLRQENAGLRDRVRALEAENADLRRRLGMDSSNSSKPPSSDPVWNRAERRSAESKAPKRKRGGQAGHPGSGLARVAVPDAVESVRPSSCGGCGVDLAGRAGRVAEVVQVHDIPEPRTVVTDYLLEEVECGCGHRTRGEAPGGASGGVAYGINLKVMAGLLLALGTVSVERTAMLLAAWSGSTPSTGWVDRVLDAASRCLSGPGAVFKRRVIDAPVLYADETPISIAGKTAYLWTFAAPDGTVWFGVHASRSTEALRSFGILQHFKGILVRDDYAAYYSMVEAGRVQLCCAHLLRALQGVIDAHGEGTEIASWALQHQAVIREAIGAVHQARDTGQVTLDPEVLARIEADYAQQAALGRKLTDGLGDADARRLAKRLDEKRHQVLLFTTRYADGVEPTNNRAERSLRHTKTKMKISGCFQTLATAKRWAAIQTYIATIHAWGHDATSALRAAFIWEPILTP